MSDRYLDLVNSGVTKKVAKQLGLPRPSVLRRYVPGAPLVPGPVLVVHDGAAEKDADTLAEALLGWDLDVHRHAAEGDRFGAVVVVLTGLGAPADLGEPMLRVGPVLRGLLPGGRVVTVSRDPGAASTTAQAAARQGVDGMLRSLAKELRGGATGNGLVLADDVTVGDPSVRGALHFLLSGRSAFVDGQLVPVTGPGVEPADPAHPLEGQVAVVTGAARGIGAAIARTLARDGATVVAVDVPASGDALATVANEVLGSALQLDVTAEDAAERIVEHVRTRHGGGIDVVVHNAGVLRDKLLANMTPERWDPVIAVNITAPVRITEALLGSGSLGPAPRFIALASTSGIAGNRGQTNYGASKAGVIGLVRASADRVAGAGGTINAVAPGFIETDMTARIPFAMRELARRLSSLQQGGQPVDVAEAVAFLASPQAGGINGRVLRVCGQNMVGA